MKCRGKINVKGKGSMITYFLQRPSVTDDNDQLTHQSSKVTTMNSEDNELCEMDNTMNVDSVRLTQKRKSLCRQHNIFSSLTNKSVTSEKQSMNDSIEYSDELAILNEKTKLIDDQPLNNFNVISPEVFPKNYFKPIKSSVHKDSIESLENLLKNDFSLSDMSSQSKILTTQPSITEHCSVDSNDSNETNHYLTDKIVPNINCNSNKSKCIKSDCKHLTMTMTTIENDDLITASKSNDTDDTGLIKMIKNKFKFRDNDRFMKLSKSLYPINQSSHSAKMENSKSLQLIPLTQQNQNGSVFL